MTNSEIVQCLIDEKVKEQRQTMTTEKVLEHLATGIGLNKLFLEISTKEEEKRYYQAALDRIKYWINELKEGK